MKNALNPGYTCSLFLLLVVHLMRAQSVCPDAIETNLIYYSEYSFSIEGIDEGVQVIWNFGDGTELLDDSLTTHAFMAGSYLITAIFFDADCPWDGPSLLSTELVVEACGIDIGFVEAKTSLFTFTAIGFPEEYPMHWDMGDGTYIEETWVVDNLYEPGTYEICAWYYTEFCPDTVEACVELVYAPDTTCSAEFSYELFESESWEGYYQITELHAWNDSPEFTYIWDLGDGPMVGTADTMMYNTSFGYGTEVCLTTLLGTCSDTVCHHVMNCDFGDLSIETTGYGIDTDEIAAFNLYVGYISLSGISDDFVLSNPDSIHLMNYCLPIPYCGYLSLDLPNEIDSIRVRIYALQNPIPVMDTIYSGGYLLVGPPGCVPISVDEVQHTFDVFPTFTNDVVDVYGPAEMNYTMFDLSGKICANGKVSSKGQISLAEHSPGMYLLFLRSGNQFYTTRIVRQP